MALINLSSSCLIAIKAAINEKRRDLIHHDLRIDILYEIKNVSVRSNDEDMQFDISAYDRRVIFKMFK